MHVIKVNSGKYRYHHAQEYMTLMNNLIIKDYMTIMDFKKYLLIIRDFFSQGGRQLFNSRD